MAQFKGAKKKSSFTSYLNAYKTNLSIFYFTEKTSIEPIASSSAADCKWSRQWGSRAEIRGLPLSKTTALQNETKESMR